MDEIFWVKIMPIRNNFNITFLTFLNDFSAFPTKAVELIWFNIFNLVLLLTPFKLIYKLFIAFLEHL